MAATADLERRGVERLRALAALDVDAARAEAWGWLAAARRGIAGRDRRRALAELAALFRAGSPPRALDGQVEGMIVGLALHPAIDRAAAAVAAARLPWAGKRFDAASASGTNLLRRSARLPARAIWPRYRLREDGDLLAGFDFRTRVERGALDRDLEVLVLDYGAVGDNPALTVKPIRDELVEVVPGVHLGRMLWRRRGRRHSLVGYFALRARS